MVYNGCLIRWSLLIIINLGIQLPAKLMLTTIAIVLIALWLIGVLTGYTLGWFIHILLVVAIIMFLVRIIQGRNPIN
jgi:hypothetical protein